MSPTPKPIPAPAGLIQPKAPSVLLMGPPGSGKTYSIITLLEAGLEVFVIITEPNGLDTLLDAVREKGLDISRLHWITIVPSNPGWIGLLDMARNINRMSYDDLTKIKSGISKENTRQAITLLERLNNFVDERTGESFGDITAFGPERAVVVDSLSGINVMAMDLHLGLKPVAHQGEWGAVMNFEEKLIQSLTSALNCIFVLTAHIEKEPNELTGASEITVSALGRKLAPKIGRWFSEVVLAKKEKGKFLWSTEESNTSLKSRGLKASSTLEPSFVPLWEAHQERLITSKGTAQ